MYSLICCSVMSMSSGASSATRQLRHFSGSESLWQKIVHHVTTLPSSCSRLLQSTLMQRHSLTLLLYTASCALRMRLNACFTSLFIALSVLWWAALARPPVKLILTCSRSSWCCACGSSSRARASCRPVHRILRPSCLP